MLRAPFKFTIIFILWFFFSPLAFSEATKIEDISDRKYLPKVLALIQGAERSIEVSMYQILLADTEESHPVYQILRALAEADRRGVKIRVILNRNLDYVSGETVPLARSLAAVEYLRSKGTEVVFAHSSHRLHDKVIVIDHRWVVEGSMNWTKTALFGNWESATLIDSPDLAREKLKRLRAIPLSPEKTLDSLGEEGELLKIPSILMKDPAYFPNLLEDKDERIFEFYLWLLSFVSLRGVPPGRDDEAISQKGGQAAFLEKQPVPLSLTLNDEELFRRFRLDPAKSHEDKRREAIRLLKKLKKQEWIGLKIAKPGANAEISLIPLRGLTPASPAGGPSAFTVPYAYFKYGYPEKLSFAGEFFYLLARLEMTESPSPPWWWRPQEHLTQTYHAHHTTLAAGSLELQRANLIEIVRNDAPEGRPHSERLVNRYRVNRLVDPGTQEVQKIKMIEKFGQENFEKAHRYAEIIDEPEDPEAHATILKWMTHYPAPHLEAAFAQVARYERNNPRRSLYYLRGILDGMKRQGQGSP